MKVKISPSRQKLIDGAIHVLSKEGVSGATTRKIAEAAGVRLATLHYHFKNKDDLLFSVLVEITLFLEKFLDDEVKPSNNIHDCINELITTIWKLIRETRQLQIVQIEMTMYAARNSTTTWIAKRQYEGYVKQYQRILENSNNDSLTHDNIRDLAQFLLSGIDGILVQDLAASNDKRSKQLLQRLIEAGQFTAKRMAASRD